MQKGSYFSSCRLRPARTAAANAGEIHAEHKSGNGKALPVDDALAPGDEPAAGAERLRNRADGQIDVVGIGLMTIEPSVVTLFDLDRRGRLATSLSMV